MSGFITFMEELALYGMLLEEAYVLHIKAKAIAAWAIQQNVLIDSTPIAAVPRKYSKEGFELGRRLYRMYANAHNETYLYRPENWDTIKEYVATKSLFYANFEECEEQDAKLARRISMWIEFFHDSKRQGDAQRPRSYNCIPRSKQIDSSEMNNNAQRRDAKRPR